MPDNLGNYYDLRPYHEARGYHDDGDRRYWEPQSYADVEPEPLLGPGAMSRHEFDTWTPEQVEEF